jgi:hypothetical protein
LTVRSVSFGPSPGPVRTLSNFYRFARPWYGRRIKWKVRIGAWLLAAIGAAVPGARYAVVGPVLLEGAFVAFLLVKYTQLRTADRQEVANLLKGNAD